jgi:glycogen synthase
MHSLISSGDIDLKDLVLQLEKDLQMSGTGYCFKSQHAHELIEELAEQLKVIDQDRGLDSLFYRIDMNPSHFDFALNDYAQLSLKIWDRIFKKVWTRKNYQP